MIVSAARGRCVITDADGQEFLRVHPAGEVYDVISWLGGPSVSFLAYFPKPGLCRAWGQLQHEARLLTAYFTFDAVQDKLSVEENDALLTCRFVSSLMQLLPRQGMMFFVWLFIA
ncbi:MAG: hypothetical protein M3115_01970, partial [Thermoproteota archaeon]|nr:hypothetical protein [Thermoproteota archaeon]